MLNYLLNYFPSRTLNWQNLFIITDRLPVVFEGRPHTSDQQTRTSKIWLTSTESKLVPSKRQAKGCSCCQVQPSWKGLETISSIDHRYRSRFEKSLPVVALSGPLEGMPCFVLLQGHFSVVKYYSCSCYIASKPLIWRIHLFVIFVSESMPAMHFINGPITLISQLWLVGLQSIRPGIQ